MSSSIPDPTHYLTPAEIYALAAEAMGREPDVRDVHLLRAAAARPMLAAFGEEAYPTLLDKAAALLHALTAHHLFFDGNKRTATRVVVEFLRRNGLQPTWDEGEIYTYVLEIAQNQHDVPQVAVWLADHTRPLTPDSPGVGEPTPFSAPPPIRYVTVDELIYMNEVLPGNDQIHKILQGRQKVRDLGLLEAAAARPQHSAFGEDAYPFLHEKAAVLLHAVARNHPFADGNKRTGTLACLFMLLVNGEEGAWETDDALEQIVAVAEGLMSATAFANWLETTSTAIFYSTPDADIDIRLIADLIAAHRPLLDALAGR